MTYSIILSVLVLPHVKSWILKCWYHTMFYTMWVLFLFLVVVVNKTVHSYTLDYSIVSHSCTDHACYLSWNNKTIEADCGQGNTSREIVNYLTPEENLISTFRNQCPDNSATGTFPPTVLYDVDQSTAGKYSIHYYYVWVQSLRWSKYLIQIASVT